MADETSADLPDGEACPGPPEARFMGVWPHHWQPIAAIDMPGVPDPNLPAGVVRVLEVRPTCRQWRRIRYTRLDPSPGIPG